MRITFASSLDYGTPGAAQARHLAYFRALARAGEDVEVLLLACDDAPSAYPDVDWVPLGAGAVSRTQSRANHYLATVRASRHIRTGSRDALVLLDFHPYLILPLIWAGRKAEIPLLHERTEYPDVLFQNLPLGAQQAKVYHDQCLPKLDGIYAITEPLLRHLLGFAAESAQGEVVGMIVDADRFTDSAPLRRIAGQIGYLGTYSFAKDGLDIAVQALASLHHDAGRHDLTLHMHGAGADRQALEVMTQAFGLGHAVEIAGPVDASQVPRLLRSADVLILPRPDGIQARYGFPTKLGEYLASGTPTVATAVGQIPRVVGDEVHCYLAEPGSPESLANSIRRALDDPRRWEVAGKGAELVRTLYDSDTAAGKIRSLIERCG